MNGWTVDQMLANAEEDKCYCVCGKEWVRISLHPSLPSSLSSRPKTLQKMGLKRKLQEAETNGLAFDLVVCRLCHFLLPSDDNGNMHAALR